MAKTFSLYTERIGRGLKSASITDQDVLKAIQGQDSDQTLHVSWQAIDKNSQVPMLNLANTEKCLEIFLSTEGSQWLGRKD